MFCQPFTEFICNKKQCKVDDRIKQSHRCGKAVALIHKPLPVNIRGNYIRSLIN